MAPHSDMKNIIDKVIASGMDIGNTVAVRRILGKIGADPDLVDHIYIDLKNEANLDDFARTPFKDRYLFLPHCMRRTDVCTAVQDEVGSWQCRHCGACDISVLTKKAEELGYGGIYCVPGGSLIKKIIKKAPPKAIMGIACNTEVVEAMEMLSIIDMPTVGVPLLRDGCKDTIANVEESLRVMALCKDPCKK